MGGGAGENKKVPDGVMVGKTPPHIEDGAGGVQYASNNKQQQAAGGQSAHERRPGNNNDPAHADVKHSRQNTKPFSEECFKNNADNGNAPDNAE